MVIKQKSDTRFSHKWDVLIIGGGFYGAYIAEHFAVRGKRVILCESETDLMLRASFSNQARVHNGYHYPRSTLTALRSHMSFPKFIDEFDECIFRSFSNYYLIGKILSKVTGRQFEGFCKRIGIPCVDAPSRVWDLVNPRLVDAAFSVTEYVFDSIVLRDIMKDRLVNANVTLSLNSTVTSIEAASNGITAWLNSGNADLERLDARQVFNCTYSQINGVNSKSGQEIIPLKHEMTEMCLVRMPEELNNAGITVMCGPFFSILPFPSTSLHSFSHVRYTPHHEWYERVDEPLANQMSAVQTNRPETAWRKMQLDGMRYLPVLADCKYESSIWEVKTILPAREVDDGRPILFKINHGIDGYHCVMGGKIDNIYDVIEIIRAKGLDA